LSHFTYLWQVTAQTADFVCEAGAQPESLLGMQRSVSNTVSQSLLLAHAQVMAQTADFVREAGGQSEFRLGMQQAGNPNFGFLRPGDRCFPYYRWLLRAAPAAAQPTPQRTASLQGNNVDDTFSLVDYLALSKKRVCSVLLSITQTSAFLKSS